MQSISCPHLTFIISIHISFQPACFPLTFETQFCLYKLAFLKCPNCVTQFGEFIIFVVCLYFECLALTHANFMKTAHANKH